MRAHQGNQEANHLGGLPDELELLDDCNRRLELEQHPRRRDPKRLAIGRLGYAKRSVCSHQRSSAVIRGHRGVIRDHHLVREQAGVRGGRGPVEDSHAVHVLRSILEMAQA